jgi:hypothetical protein
MYDIIRKATELAKVDTDIEVGLAKEAGLAEYMDQLMVDTQQLDMKRLMLSRYSSQLGQELMAQELVVFAFQGTNIARSM